MIGPREIVKALTDYVFRVEGLLKDTANNIHGTRLKFYSDLTLDARVILSHELIGKKDAFITPATTADE